MDIANFFLGRQGEDQKQLKQIRGAGPAPSARESHSCTWLGSQLYIFGGYDGSRVLNDLYAYDINNAMWKQIVHSGISPPARAGHSGTALGVPPHLVIFGGANASRRFNDVSILDTVNNQWDKPTTRGKQPVPRYFHAAGLHRSNLIVFGGNEGSSSLGDLHALNTENWTWSQPAATGAPPSARTGHSGTMVNRLFFVIGGVSDAPNNTFNTHELSDMFILDCEAMAWWRPDISPALPPIAYHAAALVADKIFIFGGATREQLYNDVIMVDTATNVWQVVMDGETGGLPKRRRHAVSRGSGTRLLFFGGWDGTQTTASLFELDATSWLRMDAVAPAPSVAANGAHGTAGTMVTGAAASKAGLMQVANLGGGGGLAFGGGGGVGQGGGGGGVTPAEFEALQRREEQAQEMMKVMRGEIARLKVANELSNKEMNRLKALVGARTPGSAGGIDPDALVTKGELEALRLELVKSKRQAAQERELATGRVQAELDEMKRQLRGLQLKLQPNEQ